MREQLIYDVKLLRFFQLKRNHIHQYICNINLKY